MALKTRGMERKSAAVTYAIKAYKGKGKPRPETGTGEPKNIVQPHPEVKVVKMKKQPVKRAIEKIRDYFS